MKDNEGHLHVVMVLDSDWNPAGVRFMLVSFFSDIIIHVSFS